MKDERKDIGTWKGKEASKNVRGIGAVFGYCLQDKAWGVEMAYT